MARVTQIENKKGRLQRRLEISYPLILLMIRFGAWNIRVLNSLIKRKKVKYFINSNNLVLMAILETRVREANMDRVRQLFWRVELCQQ